MEQKTEDLFRHLKNKRILLIDDDVSVRVSLVIFFELQGCSILAVPSAEEGIEAFVSQKFDFVLTDYRLPGISGLEFLDRIKDAHPQPKRILITAYGTEEVFAEARRMGVKSIIEKPLSKRTIVDALSKLLEIPD